MAEHQVPAFLASYKALATALKEAIVGIKLTSPVGTHLENFRISLAAHQAFAVGMMAELGSKMAAQNFESANAIASLATDRARLERELHEVRQQQMFVASAVKPASIDVDALLAQKDAELDGQIMPLLAMFNGDGGEGPGHDEWRRMTRGQRWVLLLWCFLIILIYPVPRLSHLAGIYRTGLADIQRLRASERQQNETISTLQSTINQYKDTEDNGLPNSYSDLRDRFSAMFTRRPDGAMEPTYMVERREKEVLEMKLSRALERNTRLEKKHLDLNRVRRIARHQHMRLKAYYEDDEDDEGYHSWSSTEEYRRDPGGTNSYYAKNGVPIELQPSPSTSPRGGDTTMMHSVGGLPGFAWNAQRAACDAGRGV